MHRYYLTVIIALALAVAFLAGRAAGPEPAQASPQISQATLNDVVYQLKRIDSGINDTCRAVTRINNTSSYCG